MTTPRTWVVGEVVTAAELNTEIRDQFNGIMNWTSYTPIWAAATTAPVKNSGTLVGRQSQIGKLCTAKWELATASDTTFGSGQYTFSLPFTASGSATATSVGTGHGIAGGSRWDLQTMVTAGQSVANVLSSSGSADTRLAFLGSAQGIGGIAWATAQTMRAQITYETA